MSKVTKSTVSFQLYGKQKLEEKDKDALNAFKTSIYDVFFEGDEKEKYDDILNRIGNTDASICSYAYLLYDIDNHLVGGMIADWYPKCSTLEIIYIAVAIEEQRKGYGEILLDDGLTAIISAIGRKKVGYVFFESRNPFYDFKNEKEEDKYLFSRLRFFGCKGAKRVPIDYVQPPLFEQGDFARNMCLFCLPIYSDKRKEITGIHRNNLKAFLTSFYNELSSQCPGKDEERAAELNNMKRQIDVIADNDDLVPLDDIFESSVFKINTVAVATHFLFDPAYSGYLFPPNPNNVENKSTRGDDVFYSYQTDLMDYSHQGENGPFSTNHYDLYEKVKLNLPKAYCYESEGLSHIRLLSPDHNSLEIDISLNWSSSPSKELGYQVHMVICPTKSVKNAAFTELDLIRFITAFGSKQERYQCIDSEGNISPDSWGGFSVEEMDGSSFTTTPLIEWITKELGLNPGSLKATDSGITELDISGLSMISEKNSVDRLFNDIVSFRKQIHRKDIWNKTLCGIILGIFDFNRMNTAEIYDTLHPVVIRPQSFMVFSRGHLVKIKDVDPGEDYERVENILISPYLLIPSCALAYNKRLLDYCQEQLIQTGKKEEVKASARDSEYYVRSRELLDTYNKIKPLLANHFMQGFFQYESEQFILSELNIQRGFISKLQQLEIKLDMIKEDSDKHLQIYRSGSESRLNTILLILTLLQVIVAVFAIERGCEKLAFAALAVALIIGGLIIGRISVVKDRRKSE